jgi:K+-sensing histidine kinase KdpD
MTEKQNSKKHTDEILGKYQKEAHAVEDYVKSASLLSFSFDYTNALKVIDVGLTHHPKNEELIRAKFSFASFHRDLLHALEIASDNHRIFKNDAFDPLTQALDLIRYSFNFEFPNQNETNNRVVDSIIRAYLEEQQFDVTTLVLGMIQEYNFPLIGLGFAKFFAQQNDDLACLVLGGSYLKGYNVEKNLIKAKQYISRAVIAGNQDAEKLLHEINTLPSMN